MARASWEHQDSRLTALLLHVTTEVVAAHHEANVRRQAGCRELVLDLLGFGRVQIRANGQVVEKVMELASVFQQLPDILRRGSWATVYDRAARVSAI